MSAGNEERNNAALEASVAEVLRRMQGSARAVAPAAEHASMKIRLSEFAGTSAKMNLILALAMLVSILLNCVLGWFAVHPVREYFASDNGRLFPMVPLSAPYQKPGKVIQYARDTIGRSFTMDFQNWRQQLEDTRPDYTRLGFKSYLDALDASGLLDLVRKRRMNMTVTSGTGVLVKDGVENGTYVWIVEVPIEIKLTGQNSELPAQRFKATVRVERIDTLDSIDGIGAAQLITQPL